MDSGKWRLAAGLNTAFVLGLAALQCSAQSPPTITLDGNGTGRVFDGLGGVSAGASSRLLIDYPEPYRSQILDYLFKPNYGASLQHLKVELGGDMDSTDGAEPSHMHSATDQNYTRGYEWWLMQQAALRNPSMTFGALEWGAPGWIGHGQFFSQDNINYILNFIQGARTNYGLTLGDIGIWNETPYDINWIISLKAALQSAGLATKVVAADEPSDDWGIVADMNTYAALMSAVDIVGIHYPNGGSASSAQLLGKPLWASEDGPWRGDWTGAKFLAKEYNRNYIGGKITSTEIWSLITSYYDMLAIPGSGLMYANTPWSGHYDVEPAIWITAHTTQFAQPGWQYIDSACGLLGGSGSYVTLKNGSDYSVVIETMDAGSNQTLGFQITGGLATGPVHVWMSNSTAQFVQQSDIVPVNGYFTITLAPGSIYSLTTTTGQGKGNVTAPPAAAFPIPYSDTFDSYALGQEAQYFSTINGSFEIAACGGGRGGHCLRQAVNAAPIPWHAAGPAEPAAFIGSTSWTNYQVSVDALLEEPGEVKLIGRLSSEDITTGNVAGFQLYLSSTGGWALCHNSGDVLASGTVPFSLNTWHNLALVFNGSRIQASIDNAVVASVTDENYPNGMAGLGVRDWTNAQFDNFRIDPLPGQGQIVPQSQMTATATSAASGYDPSKAVDGSPSTFWHTAYTCVGGCQPSLPLPQSITLALGANYTINELRYLPRQDGNSNGTITSYNVYLSSDGNNFAKVAAGSWPNTPQEKIATFAAATAAWIRLEATGAVNGYASAAEINIEYTSAAGNPGPLVTGLNPNSALAGSGGFNLDVTGNNFVNGSAVLWNGSALPTTFVNSTLLTASVPASDILAPGDAGVSVTNPAPAGSSNSVSFTISASSSGGPGTTAFLTGFSTSGRPLRTDFSGWVGMQLGIGSNPLTVSALGRVCVAGNSSTHTVKLVNAANGADIPGASVSVNMNACPAGQFAWSSLSPAITLPAGSVYYLVSQEVQGGDQWYDYGAVSAEPDAAVRSSVYSFNGSNWIPIGPPNTSYVPVNFEYTVVTPSPIAVTLDTSPPALAFSVDSVSYNAGQTFNWTSGVSHTIAASSPQSAGTGAQYTWSSWSDGGAASHSIAPTGDTTLTANFTLQYLLTSSVSPPGAGSITAAAISAGGFYSAGSTFQLTATPAPGCAFTGWSGALGGSTDPQNITMSSPQTVTANFQCTAPPATAFLTSASLSGRPLRNDFNGWVGMQITVGSDPLIVSALGRVCIAGNSRMHSVKLVNATGGMDVPGASIVVNLAGCAAGQFAWSPVTPSVTLPAGGRFYLVSLEAQGGDQWYDYGAIATTADAVVSSAVYSTNGASWIPIGGANTSYVPPNIQYSVAPADPNPPFVLSYALSNPALRNDYAGWVGMALTAGPNLVAVNSLGRICLAGNAGTHSVKLVSALTGQDIPGGSVLLNMAGCTAGSFLYGALASPLTLASGARYYLVSQEAAGGDQWYDFGAISTRPVATVTSALYGNGSGWFTIGGQNLSYGPVSFK